MSSFKRSENLGKWVLIEEEPSLLNGERRTLTIINKKWIIDPKRRTFLWPDGSLHSVMEKISDDVEPESDWTEVVYRKVVCSSDRKGIVTMKEKLMQDGKECSELDTSTSIESEEENVEYLRNNPSLKRKTSKIPISSQKLPFPKSSHARIKRPADAPSDHRIKNLKSSFESNPKVNALGTIRVEDNQTSSSFQLKGDSSKSLENFLPNNSEPFNSDNSPEKDKLRSDLSLSFNPYQLLNLPNDEEVWNNLVPPQAENPAPICPVFQTDATDDYQPNNANLHLTDLDNQRDLKRSHGPDDIDGDQPTKANKGTPVNPIKKLKELLSSGNIKSKEAVAMAEATVFSYEQNMTEFKRIKAGISNLNHCITNIVCNKTVDSPLHPYKFPLKDIESFEEFEHHLTEEDNKTQFTSYIKTQLNVRKSKGRLPKFDVKEVFDIIVTELLSVEFSWGGQASGKKSLSATNFARCFLDAVSNVYPDKKNNVILAEAFKTINDRRKRHHGIDTPKKNS